MTAVKAYIWAIWKVFLMDRKALEGCGVNFDYHSGGDYKSRSWEQIICGKSAHED